MTRFSFDESLLRGKLTANRSLSGLNTWKVGGRCEQFYSPRDADDLSCFLRHCPADIRLSFLGRGSNVLIPDDGIDGCALSLTETFTQLSCEGETVTAEAGVTCQKLVSYCIKRGLGGLEFLVAIPGTVGGALAMNAGSLGREIWETTLTLVTINREGVIRERPAADFTYGYRFVDNLNEWFIAAEFAARAQSPGKSRGIVREILRHRRATQPVNAFSCGSVFKNPRGDFAARIIEECGLKGRSVGDAEVSRKHANFIVNRGAASASDIHSLLLEVQDCVLRKTNVFLEPEVKILESR